MKKFFIICIGIILSLHASAQFSSVNKTAEQKKVEQSITKHTQNLTEKLGLSAKQQVKVQNMLTKEMKKVEDSKATARMEAIVAHKDEKVHEEIKKLLTKEQLDKLDALKKEEQQDFKKLFK